MNNQCATCGIEIPKEAPLGQCASCLMDLGGTQGVDFNEEEMAAPGKTEDSLKDYELLRQIGSGGMGLVYEARQKSLNRTVALKMIRSELASPLLLRRFLIEGEAAARLDHPNIVPIYEISDKESQSFLSMKMINGETLKTRIKRGDYKIPENASGSNRSTIRIRETVIVQLILSIAQAVQHAHDQGVFHRDLKPANILIDSEGKPHITDFGLAKVLSDVAHDPKLESLTLEGTALGTPEYMSPEQSYGVKLLEDGQLAISDVYSLGVIFYELLTGRRPHHGSSHIETMRKVREDDTRFPRSLNAAISKDLEAVVMKCLEKNPLDRYASAEDLAHDLENWLEGKPITARRDSLTHRTLRWVNRNRVGATIILILSLSLLTVAYFWNSALKGEQGEREAYLQLEEYIAGVQERVLEDIRNITLDPNQTNSVILAEDLAIMDYRDSIELPTTGYRLQYGADIDDDPSTMVDIHARMFGLLESKMSSFLRQTNVFDLHLFKMGHEGYTMLLNGEVDFMIMNPLDYLRCKAFDPKVEPVAISKKEAEMVIFTHTNSGISQLSQIKGKSFVFGNENNAATWWAKSRLAKAGVRVSDLKDHTHFMSEELIYQILLQPNISDVAITAERETPTAVLDGLFDVGVVTRKQFSKNQYLGLKELDKFKTTPKLFVARSGLDPKVIKAFQIAVAMQSQEHWTEALPGDSESGFSPIQDSNLDDLRKAVNEVMTNFN